MSTLGRIELSRWVVIVGLALVWLLPLVFRGYRRRRSSAIPGPWAGVASVDTPQGAWLAHSGSSTTSIQFDGRGEGTYSQLMESDLGTEREFGHWALDSDGIRMLIMATDRREHPLLGIDTKYQVSYVGSDEILISGPDRPGIRFTRAPPGTTVEVAPTT